MKKEKPKIEIHNEPIIKWVKKANKFCRTYWEHGIQKQEWFDKPCDIDSSEFVDVKEEPSRR